MWTTSRDPSAIFTPRARVRALALAALLGGCSGAGDESSSTDDGTGSTSGSTSEGTAGSTAGGTDGSSDATTSATTDGSSDATTDGSSDATTDGSDATTDPTATDTGEDTLDPDVDPLPDGDWYHPNLNTSWQWQLLIPDGEVSVNTSYDVDLYDIDLFDNSAAFIAGLKAEGRVVICYFSGGSYEEWRDDADDFEPATLGDDLDGWDGERWLDIRAPSVLAIMRARLDEAVARGCDGVEPDNMDGYTNDTGFPLTAADQLAYNKWMANEAHSRGLAVGLKNDGGQAEELVAFFDFSLNEECHAYDECGDLSPFTSAGKPILNAEYADSLVDAEAAAGEICPEALAADLRTLILPLDLDDSFRVSCD
ncbi:MAG: endo alpha-1,4 polygalactosaminidase [Nannocystaceae bacterium]